MAKCYLKDGIIPLRYLKTIYPTSLTDKTFTDEKSELDWYREFFMDSINLINQLHIEILELKNALSDKDLNIMSEKEITALLEVELNKFKENIPINARNQIKASKYDLFLHDLKNYPEEKKLFVKERLDCLF